MVTGRHPFSFLDQSCGIFINFRCRGDNLVHGGLVPRSCTLNVIQRLLQTPQLDRDLLLGLFRILNSHLLEALDRFNLLADIVGFGLERLEVLLDLVDHGRVLQYRAVVREVDAGGLLGEHLNPAASIVVSLLEVCERGGSAAAEAELGADFAPVELRNRACLLGEVLAVGTALLPTADRREEGDKLQDSPEQPCREVVRENVLRGESELKSLKIEVASLSSSWSSAKVQFESRDKAGMQPRVHVL